MTCDLCHPDDEFICMLCLESAPYFRITQSLRNAKTLDELKSAWGKHNEEIADIKNNPVDYFAGLFIWIENAKNYYKEILLELK